MKKYHKYIFNLQKKKFVGNFEEMYQMEKTKIFDSWHQEDSRQLHRKIALEILSNFNFQLIIDIGSGKGTLTHLLKKNNNKVIGFDISKTATKIANSRYLDIEFKTLDLNKISILKKNLDLYIKKHGKIDLIFSAECLSYLHNWKKLIRFFSKNCSYILLTLFLPEDPLGYVKSFQELEEEVSNSFNLLESIIIKKKNFIIIFAENLDNNLNS